MHALASVSRADGAQTVQEGRGNLLDVLGVHLKRNVLATIFNNVERHM